MATQRVPCPPAPGPLEGYARHFDAGFASLAQRRAFREYLQGLLLPRDRNKTLTGLAGVEPVLGAQLAPAQRLQWFLSESSWEAGAIAARRLELLLGDPATAPTEAGVLVIDETGDRKDGTKTDHVAPQYLGSIGRIANGIVSVTSLWADERVYYPLRVAPYTPAGRLPRGKLGPDFRTKPQLAVELIDAAIADGFTTARWWPIASTASTRRCRRRCGTGPSRTCWPCAPAGAAGRPPTTRTRPRTPPGSWPGAGRARRATGRRWCAASATATASAGGRPTCVWWDWAGTRRSGWWR
jgi:hypothetical protein